MNGFSTRAQSAGIGVVTVMLFLVGLYFMISLGTSPTNSSRVTTVVDEQGNVLTLPLRWLTRQSSEASRHFYVTLNASNYGESLYVPAFEQSITIRDEQGTALPVTAATGWYGPTSYASQIVQLPPNTLGQSRRFELEITAAPLPIGSLSALYVGDDAVLQSHYQMRHAVNHYLRIMVFGSQLFLALCCLIFTVVRPSDQTFVWLGTTMVASCLASLGLFAEVFQGVIPWVPWLLILLVLVSLAFLGFASTLTGRAWTKPIAVACFAVPLILYGLMLSGWVASFYIILLLVIPITILGITIAMLLLLENFRQRPSLDIGVLIAGIALMVVAVLHDQLAKLTVIESDLMLAMPSRSIALAGIALFLMLRIARITSALDHSAQLLKSKLEARESELATLYAREQRFAVAAAKKQERDAILSELHDGVAGQLSTIIALAEIDQDAQSEIQQVARDALGELRMVINALALPEGDLRLMLVTFCERSEGPLKRLGIRFDWSFVALPDHTIFNPTEMLSILRILQEALTNAVKHGQPEEIRIKAYLDQDARLCIDLDNHGGLQYVASARSKDGIGIRSMTERAGALGASVTLSGLTDGARLRLCLLGRAKYEAPGTELHRMKDPPATEGGASSKRL